MWRVLNGKEWDDQPSVKMATGREAERQVEAEAKAAAEAKATKAAVV